MRTLIVAVSLSLLSFTLGAQEPVFKDGFDAYANGSDGGPKWKPAAGEWRVLYGEYVQKEHRYTETLTFLQDLVLSDFEFSVRFTPTSVGSGVKAAGMVFRAQSTRDFYYVHFDSAHSQVILVRSSRKRSWHELKRVPRVSIRQDSRHEGRVVCKGNRISVYLDGKPICEATDDAYAVGRIGLRAGQGVIRFDDVRVEGTRAEPAKKWEDIPVPVPEIEKDAPLAEGVERIVASRGQGYFPVLVKLHNGELIAVIRGGAPHVGVGGRLDVIKSKDGGKTWSPPKTVADMPPDSRNPAFGQAEDGRVILSFSLTGPYENGKFTAESRKYTVWQSLSEDNGATWSKCEKVDIGEGLYGSPYGRIICLKDGTLLQNIYTWRLSPSGTGSEACVYRSRDGGKTWGDRTVIAAGYNETTLLELPDGRLLASVRSGSGATFVSESSDSGRTWTRPRPVLGSSRHPSDIILLKSGNLLMTTGHRIMPYGVLALLSRDMGKTWDVDGRVLLEWKSGNTDCGYPSSVQLDDGTIVTMYYGVAHEDHPGLNKYAMCVRYREDLFTRGK